MLRITNLHEHAFPERFLMQRDIQDLLDSANNPYQLSMPLLASAQLGNQDLYQRSLLRINAALSSFALDDASQNSFKAWLYGRVLLAADSMHDGATVTKVLATLHALLQDKNTTADRFTAWTYGYVAALNNDEYRAVKEPMKQAADQLTAAAHTINEDVQNSADKKQEARSDALWAWVMSVQAAANAKDAEMYEYALEQMRKITQQTSIADALTKGLLRTAASNDYPAWALAIVRLSAATMGYGYKDLFASLAEPLQESIQQAEAIKAKPEAILAHINHQLALQRQQQALSPASAAAAKPKVV